MLLNSYMLEFALGVNKSLKISKEDILTCVGINREYNFFEFQDSLVDRSALKCSRILNFFIRTHS